MNSNNLYAYGFVTILSIISFSLVNRLPIPYELYYYITKVDQSLLTDPLTIIFQLLKTPSYFLIEFFYDNPIIFFWTSFLIDLIFSILLFYFVYSISKNSLVSLIVIFIFSPFMFAILSKINFDPGFRVIHLYGYGSYIFSTRYIFGLLSLFSFFFLVQKKYNLSLIFYSLSLLSHPSSGLLAGIFLLSTILIIRINFKYIIKFLIYSLIGLAPTFIKLWNLNNFNPNVNILSNKDWYLRLIHDEPDDFSLIFNLIETPMDIIITSFIVCLLSYHLYKNLNLDKLIKKILYCSLCLPIFFYFIFLVLEYLSVYFNFFLLVDPIIKTQAGLKILKFCYFPIVISTALILKDKTFLQKYSYNINSKLKSLFYLILLIGPLIFIFVNPQQIKNKKVLLSNLNKVKKNNYLDYIYASSFINKNIPIGYSKDYFISLEKKPKYIREETNYLKISRYIKSLKNKEMVYDKKFKKYNDPNIYRNLYSAVKSNIPEKSSVFILPYILHFRDVLPNYNFFYLEHPDGNLSLGSKRAASIISQRLKDLVDADHKDLHLNFTFLFDDLRERYLNIDDKKIDYLINKYPNYKYFVTESGHELNKTKIFEDNYYVIYNLN